jgi:methionyl-tRNA synthetase
MKKLRGFLGMEESAWELLGSESLLESGHSIEKASLLFEKVEDNQIQQQLDKLHQSREDNEETPSLSPPKPEISFDDFTRMDLRTGTILEAEKVPKTKKLIKMQVDLGFEKRTIVSGIAEFFEPETLPGKRVSVLANLAPRKIKGIESQGMILLSENPDGSLHFVEPAQAAENGSEIN